MNTSSDTLSRASDSSPAGRVPAPPKTTAAGGHASADGSVPETPPWP